MGETCVADHRLSHDRVSWAARHGLGVIWFTMSEAKPCTAVSFHQVQGREGPGKWHGQSCHSTSPAAPSLFPQPTSLTSWKFLWNIDWLCLHTSDPFRLALCPRTLTYVDTASLWLPGQLDPINRISIGGCIECIEHLFHALSPRGWCTSDPSYFPPQPQSLLGNLSTVLILTKLWEHCSLPLFLHFQGW